MKHLPETRPYPPTGPSLAAIGLVILLIAIDFAVIRTALLSSGLDGWVPPGARLLPYMLTDAVYNHGPARWAVFAFFLLPMINSLLIGVYRLRRRGDHTAGTVGYVIAGSVATVAVFASCLISPATAIGMLMPIGRTIALASFHGLERVVGHATPQTLALEWAYAGIFAVAIPIAFFCIPPLLVALIGRWVARRFGPCQPTAGVGLGASAVGAAEPA